MPKFFADAADIGMKEITLRGDDARHIASVLRHRAGDQVTIGDGAGIDYECRLMDISPREVRAEILRFSESRTELKTRITLFQGLPKADKMELIIQKAVELGVHEITPFAAKRSIAALDKPDKAAKKLERWQKISESAAKQSGRGIIPKIKPPLSFSEAVTAARSMDGAIIPYELERERGIRDFIQDFSGGAAAVLIGPEGGFAPEEIDEARSAGIMCVTLGSRILRTETAGLFALSVLSYELG